MSKVTKRVTQGTQDINHDLFKLEVAMMKKNVSFVLDDPKYEDVEHCHFFHTVDSSGRPQSQCNPVGNHFHEIKVIDKGEGNVPEIQVSHPKRHSKKGKKIIVIDCPDDHHTHTVTYKGSQIVKPRQVNAEYIKVQAALDARVPKSVEGVQ